MSHFLSGNCFYKYAGFGRMIFENLCYRIKCKFRSNFMPRVESACTFF